MRVAKIRGIEAFDCAVDLCRQLLRDPGPDNVAKIEKQLPDPELLTALLLLGGEMLAAQVLRGKRDEARRLLVRALETTEALLKA